MIVHTHHSFFDNPISPPKVKTRKPLDIEAERDRKRAYYQAHKDDIKLRRLQKDLSKSIN